MAKCKNCGAEITWIKTRKGKNIPVDGLELKEGQEKPIFDRATMTCHFDTCSKKPAGEEEPKKAEDSAQTGTDEEIPF